MFLDGLKSVHFWSVSSGDRRKPRFGCGLGRVSFIYTFFRLYRWTGWNKCWTFLVLLAVTVSVWQMTPHPPAWNEAGGALEYVTATPMTQLTQPLSPRQTWPSSYFLVPPLTPFVARRPRAVTWAWPWQSWGRGWRVLCRAEGRGRWLFPGGAAGRPGAPQCGACTGPTTSGFGW